MNQRTCIYYELEDPLEEELLAARQLAGAGAIEIARRGIMWPEKSSTPPELPNERDQTFRNPLMAWIEGIRPAFETAGPASMGFVVDGISLFEIARYKIFFDLEKSEHRWWVIGTILKNWSPDTVIWVSRSASATELRELAALLKSAEERLPIKLTALANAPSLGRNWPRMKDMLWPHVDMISRAARSVFHRSQPHNHSGRQRVLFTEFFSNSVKASLPVAKALSSDSAVEVMWLAARGKVKEKLTECATESLLLDDFVSSRTIIRSGGKQRPSHFKEVFAHCALLGETTCGAGKQKYRAHIIERVVAAAVRDAARWVGMYRAALEALRPNVVVSTTYSSIPGRAAALVARHLNIPTAFLQHGVYPDEYVWSFFCNDLKIMWGEYERRSLLRNGSLPSSVYVAGATIYDELFARAVTQEKMLPEPGTPLKVAFMASRTGGMMSSVPISKVTLLAVAEAARKLSADLTVKVHPGDSTNIPEEVMADYPEFRVVRSGNSQDVVMANDLVIVVSSTTGHEACVANRPLIVFNLTGVDGFVSYVQYQAAVSVTRAEDLAPTIKRIQSDPNLQRSLAEGRQRLIADLLNGGHANAAEKAAQAILELSHAGRPERGVEWIARN